MALVELREILTEGDRRAVLGLRRGPGQDAYLDSMEDIFAEEQGNGYGAATIDAVVGYLLTRPGADTLFTSCADGPGSPRGASTSATASPTRAG